MPPALTTRADCFRLRNANWWRQACVYQIYPRSFADSNGDGIGDLRGIISRVGYLADLGVDAVWLSPFYPSALADGGYDVDDHRDVDPTLGTLADFDDLVRALHEAGMGIIVDLVPNHSSDRHEWFRSALAAPKGSPERDRYIFRDGLGENGELPPADWQSTFGGPAWEPVGDGQWYFHFFAPEQPDLNWDAPEVRAYFLETLRFWSDRGVDGFRVDVAHGLSKDLPGDLPTQAELLAMDKSTGQHPLWDRDAVHDIYAEWRRVFDEYDPPRFAVAEAWVETPQRRARYASAEGLGQAFNFDLLEAEFDAAQFRSTITDNLAHVSSFGSSTTWVFSSHDVVRHATRYGLAPVEGPGVKQGAEWLSAGGPRDQIDLEAGLRRARAASLLMLALPGSAYLYQGEELGLGEVAEIPDEQRQDPVFFRTTPDARARDGLGRDGCRVPLPWTSAGTSYGFGSAGAHLPQPEWFKNYSVETQDGDPDSTLELYRRALKLRRELQASESLLWLEHDSQAVLHFRRENGWVSVTNFGPSAVSLPDGEILLSSGPFTDHLPAETTVWLRGVPSGP